MASAIVFHPLTDEADRILEAFEEQTGLDSERLDDGGRRFPLEGADHGVDVVQTLTDIDEDWTDHLSLGDPEE